MQYRLHRETIALLLLIARGKRELFLGRFGDANTFMEEVNDTGAVIDGAPCCSKDVEGIVNGAAGGARRDRADC